jgi:hypothetical protein
MFILPRIVGTKLIIRSDRNEKKRRTIEIGILDKLFVINLESLVKNIIPELLRCNVFSLITGKPDTLVLNVSDPALLWPLLAKCIADFALSNALNVTDLDDKAWKFLAEKTCGLFASSKSPNILQQPNLSPNVNFFCTANHLDPLMPNSTPNHVNATSVNTNSSSSTNSREPLMTNTDSNIDTNSGISNATSVNTNNSSSTNPSASSPSPMSVTARLLDSTWFEILFSIANYGKHVGLQQCDVPSDLHHRKGLLSRRIDEISVGYAHAMACVMPVNFQWILRSLASSDLRQLERKSEQVFLALYRSGVLFYGSKGNKLAIRDPVIAKVNKKLPAIEALILAKNRGVEDVAAKAEFIRVVNSADLLSVLSSDEKERDLELQEIHNFLLRQVLTPNMFDFFLPLLDFLLVSFNKSTSFASSLQGYVPNPNQVYRPARTIEFIEEKQLADVESQLVLFYDSKQFTFSALQQHLNLCDELASLDPRRAFDELLRGRKHFCPKLGDLLEGLDWLFCSYSLRALKIASTRIDIRNEYVKLLKELGDYYQRAKMWREASEYYARLCELTNGDEVLSNRKFARDCLRKHLAQENRFDFPQYPQQISAAILDICRLIHRIYSDFLIFDEIQLTLTIESILSKLHCLADHIVTVYFNIRREEKAKRNDAVHTFRQFEFPNGGGISSKLVIPKEREDIFKEWKEKDKENKEVRMISDEEVLEFADGLAMVEKLLYDGLSSPGDVLEFPVFKFSSIEGGDLLKNWWFVIHKLSCRVKHVIGLELKRDMMSEWLLDKCFDEGVTVEIMGRPWSLIPILHLACTTLQRFAHDMLGNLALPKSSLSSSRDFHVERSCERILSADQTAGSF